MTEPQDPRAICRHDRGVLALNLGGGRQVHFQPDRVERPQLPLIAVELAQRKALRRQKRRGQLRILSQLSLEFGFETIKRHCVVTIGAVTGEVKRPGDAMSVLTPEYAP